MSPGDRKLEYEAKKKSGLCVACKGDVEINQVTLQPYTYCLNCRRRYRTYRRKKSVQSNVQAS